MSRAELRAELRMDVHGLCLLASFPTQNEWGRPAAWPIRHHPQPPCLDGDLCFISTRLPVRLWLAGM